MVVDPAIGHPFQGEFGHLSGAGVAASVPLSQQEAQRGRVWKLGCAAKPAVFGIELAGQLARRLAQWCFVRLAGVCCPGFEAGQGTVQRGVLLFNGLALFTVGLFDLAQQVTEGGQAVARLRREIGAGKERAVIAGGEKNRQWPAARAARQ